MFLLDTGIVLELRKARAAQSDAGLAAWAAGLPRQKLFISAFNAHCIENLLGRCKFNPDIYAGPFSAREIEVRNDTCTYNGTAYTAQAVIYGLDVVTGELANGDI